jgi:hypothetical protein
LLTATQAQRIPLISPGDIVYLPKRKRAFVQVFLSVTRDVISVGALFLIFERFL